jgi:hypothetical protein
MNALIAEHRAANTVERDRIMNLPLDELIAKSYCPDCRPGLDYECCDTCRIYRGHYTSSEKESRFTSAEIEQINSLWNGKKGFLGEGGCVLPRELRSEACLRMTCSKHRKRVRK